MSLLSSGYIKGLIVAFSALLALVISIMMGYNIARRLEPMLVEYTHAQDSVFNP